MSGDQQSDEDGLNLDDRDRLPWLEPAGADEEPETVSPGRVIGLVLLGLLLLGVIGGGGYWLSHRNSGGGGGGDARLIQAEGRSYKIPANASDAKEFDGEGDAAFAASEGGDAAGRIDASKVPEAPRTDLQAATRPEPAAPKPATAKPTVSAAVKSVAADSKKAGTASDAATAGAVRIQLGAFGSKDLAESVWKKMAGRFDYLAALGHTVEPVETGGKTLYRLRADVVSAADATSTCGKLRVAGESCMVVR
jgi:hypothetical protein